jgi:hypothetical protein
MVSEHEVPERRLLRVHVVPVTAGDRRVLGWRLLYVYR